MALPASKPVTTPVLLTVATDGLVLVQVPPLTVLVRVTEPPAQTVEGPDKVPAVAVLLTVIRAVAVSLPQLADVVR